MSKVGKGIMPPAKLEDIVDLSQNQISVHDNKTKETATFAVVKLTSAQMAKLTYPKGFAPTGTFVYYNINKLNADKSVMSTQSLLLALLDKDNDGYYYGKNFLVKGVPFITDDTLKNEKKAISLPATATFTDYGYLETYLEFHGHTLILGLDGEHTAYLLGNDGKQFYYTQFNNEVGIKNPTEFETKLDGLSKSLKKLKKSADSDSDSD